MAGATTEHAQLSIFAKLVSDGCGVSGRGLRFVELLVFVKLVVLVAVVRFVTARSLIFLVVGFVVVVVGLVFSGVGFFCRGVPNDGNRCDAQGFSFWQVSEASLADP